MTLTPVAAYATIPEHCTVSGTIQSIEPDEDENYLISLLVTESDPWPGYIPCSSPTPDETVEFPLAPDGVEDLMEGYNLTVIRTTFDGIGPNGPVHSESWSLPDEDRD